MESSLQESVRFRDITVVYRDIEIPHKVSKLQIVREYFRNVFQHDLDQLFSEQAKLLQIEHYVELKQLKTYDVRLNSRDDGSVMNVTFDFSAYSAQKRLKFYVIDLTDSPLAQDQEQYLHTDTLEVVLLTTPQRSRLYKTKDLHVLSMQQLLRRINEDFQLDQPSQLILFDLSTNKQLRVEHKQKTTLFLGRNRLSRLGVRQLHSAG